MMKIIKYFSNIDYVSTTILQNLKLKFNLCAEKKHDKLHNGVS
jgi:hypothetical protein